MINVWQKVQVFLLFIALKCLKTCLIPVSNGGSERHVQILHRLYIVVGIPS